MSRMAGFVLLSFAFLVTMFGTTLPTPLYPLFQEKYSFCELTTPSLFAVYAFGVIAGLLPVRRALGRGRAASPSSAAGLALSARKRAAVRLSAGSLVPIYAGRILSGLSAGIFTGTATAALVDLVPGDRRRLASLVAIVVNLGGLGLGTLIAGVIADHASSPLRLPFVVDLVLLAAAGVALALTPETIRGRKLRLRLQRLAVPKEVRTSSSRVRPSGSRARPSRACSGRSPRSFSPRSSARRVTRSPAASSSCSSRRRRWDRSQCRTSPTAGR